MRLQRTYLIAACIYRDNAIINKLITSVYAIYHMKNFDFKKMQTWFIITVFLGVGFLGLEIYEFNHYVT